MSFEGELLEICTADGKGTPKQPIERATLLVDHGIDGDGHASVLTAGGTDCDDRRAWVHPGAWDAPGDRVDADCDGDDPDGPWVRPRWRRRIRGRGRPSPL